MFQHRASEFDPRVTAIAGHLRAIEKELGSLGKTAGRRASSGVSAASNQIVEAVKLGAQMGSDALGQIAGQARRRPLVTLAVAIGVGVLIGAVARRN
jgi:hypothetical protein